MMTRKLTALLVCLLVTALCVPAMATQPSQQTLQEQIDAAGTTPTTITVDQDYDNIHLIIAQGQNITLNLNGKQLNGGTENTAPTIINNGTLTVTGNGTVRRDDDINTNTRYYVVYNTGTMTIKSGYFYNDSGKADAWAGASLVCNIGTASRTAVLNIDGGTFEQQRFGVLKNDEYSEINITDGLFITQGGRIADVSYVYAAVNYGKLNISGGEFTGAVATNSYHDSKTNLDSIGVTTITGGTFTDAISVRRYDSTAGEAATSILGGTFTGKLDIADNVKFGITNGRFATNPDAKHVEADLVLKDNDPDAPYSIGKDAENAIANAPAGSTLTVIKGIEINNVPAGVTVVNNTPEKIVVNGEPVQAGETVVIPGTPTPTPVPGPTAAPVKPVPQTGDNTPIALYGLCAVLALACAAWLVRRKGNA